MVATSGVGSLLRPRGINGRTLLTYDGFPTSNKTDRGPCSGDRGQGDPPTVKGLALVVTPVVVSWLGNVKQWKD